MSLELLNHIRFRRLNQAIGCHQRYVGTSVLEHLCDRFGIIGGILERLEGGQIGIHTDNDHPMSYVGAASGAKLEIATPSESQHPPTHLYPLPLYRREG